MANVKIPAYCQVEADLRRGILRGQFSPMQRLPTEEDLAREFQVSKITIRAALANLAAEGLVIKKHGKGTFVAKNPIKKQVVFIGDVQSFVQHAEKEFKVKLLALETRRIRDTRMPQELTDFFQLKSEDRIGVIHRIRLLKRTPVMLIENFLRAELADRLTPDDLAVEPLQRVLKKKLGLEFARSETYLESVSGDPDVAKMLGADIIAPLFLYHGYLWLPSGEPFEVANIFMQPAYFKYKLGTT
ncbi:MAG: GntR family transcriptional regulator [bacterium]